VREHYPAFALVAHTNYRVDDYIGFHSDIFVHTDGHAYINNNVGASSSPPCRYSSLSPSCASSMRVRARTSPRPVVPSTRATTPNTRTSAELFRRVRERGWDLRFGASAAITSALLMAPLSALMVVLMFDTLRRRGLALGRALLLSAAFAFATPLFFRTAFLNHNMMVMYATFGAWCLLEAAPATLLPLRTAALAGLIAGWAPCATTAAS